MPVQYTVDHFLPQLEDVEADWMKIVKTPPTMTALRLDWSLVADMSMLVHQCDLSNEEHPFEIS